MPAVWALIAYGSLFPFAYVPHAMSADDLRTLLTAWPARLSAPDVVGNVLLFMPLGLLAAVQGGRGGRRLAWLAAGAAYAWAVQYLQFWFPSRVPSASDAWFNTAGLCVGMLVGDRVRRWGAGTRAWRIDDAPLAVPAALLLAAWVAYRWFPLVPSLDPQNLKNGLKPLLLAPRWDSLRVLHDTAAWWLWRCLFAHVPLRGLRRARIAFAAACVVAVEPFFWANAVSLSNVAGLGIALALPTPRAHGSAPPKAVLLLLAVSVVASGLAPWEFGPVARDFRWMPFAGMLDGNMVVNAAALVEKCFLYGGLVFLLGADGLRFRRAGWTAAVLLAGIEWAQRWVPGRVAEITDPLMAILAGWLFAVLASSARPPGRTGAPTAALPDPRSVSDEDFGACGTPARPARPARPDRPGPVP